MLESGVLERACHLAREHHVTVLAGQANGAPANVVQRRDELLVDAAGKHHLDDFHGLAVGNAQTGRKFALDAEPLQHGADLRAATVDHDRVHTGLFEKHYIAGEIAGDRFVAHGVAAIFDDDGAFRIALHIGQRLGQHRRPLVRGDARLGTFFSRRRLVLFCHVSAPR